MKSRNYAPILAFATVLAPAIALAAESAASQPASNLKWVNAGVPGVETAVVRGDMKAGASHFYLKYPAGFAAPLHHHSPDHYATTVSGQLVLIVDGKEQRMPPGSYFAFVKKAKHAARCEGTEPCVMFIGARGPWDVVLAKDKGTK